MANEWIDIVDTAVKVGLGALISGIATFYVNKYKNTHDSTREKKATKREVLLEAIKLSEEYMNFLFEYFSRIAGVVEKGTGKELTDEDWEEIWEFLQIHDAKTMDFRNKANVAQSRFTMLGLKNCSEEVKLLREGEEVLRKFYTSRQKQLPTAEQLGVWAKEYLPYKHKLQEQVANAFDELC